jgi:hypothetical protein
MASGQEIAVLLRYHKHETGVRFTARSTFNV